MKTKLKNKLRSRGFALLLAMSVIFVLTVIVAAFLRAMSVEMRLARNTDYDVEMEWMGRSGIELAKYALTVKCPGQQNIDALNQFWAGGNGPCSNSVPAEISLKDVEMGAGRFSVTITDMERKWDINIVADPRQPQLDVLQRAMNVVGVTDTGVSSTIIDSIQDWIGGNGDPHFNGAKSDYYLTLAPPYYCKNGRIDDLSELLLIKGVTPEIYWGSNSTNHPPAAYQQHEGAFDDSQNSRKGIFRNDNIPTYPVGLEELFSPMGGRLNINTASVKTLQLIPGIDESTAERIVQQRAGPDGVDGTEDDVPFQNPGELNSGLGGGVGGNVPGAPGGGVAAQQLARYCDVRSYVFEVKVDAEINGYHRQFIGIVSRPPNNPNKLDCVRFYWK